MNLGVYYLTLQDIFCKNILFFKAAFMKRNQIFSILSCAAILFVVAGCSTVRELAPEKRLGEPAAVEYKLSREILVNFINKDFEKCRQNLTPENQQKFDLKKVEDVYAEISHSLGTPVSFSYLTELEFVTFKIYVWKIKFRRIGKERGTGKEKEFFSEALFRVITGRTGKDQVMIMGFNFL